MILLNDVSCPSVVIAMRVANHKVFYLRRIEAELPHPTGDDPLRFFIVVERVDQDDAFGRCNSPGGHKFRSEKVDIVEYFRRLGQHLVTEQHNERIGLLTHHPRAVLLLYRRLWPTQLEPSTQVSPCHRCRGVNVTLRHRWISLPVGDAETPHHCTGRDDDGNARAYQWRPRRSHNHIALPSKIFPNRPQFG